MHQLIATYLFQYKQCPLMNYGHLYIDRTAAEPNFLNKQIDAPQQKICFSDSVINADSFINYVALQKNMAFENAKAEVEHFMQHFFASPQNNLKGIGTFNKEEDKITFESVTLNPFLSSPATAERVIHEAAEHNMLVGDKETTTTQMTEYFSETDTVKERWWIWAIVLGLIGIAVIAYYYLIENQV